MKYTVVSLLVSSLFSVFGATASWKFDCGAKDSPVMAGYRKLTPDQRYSKAAGFGWEKGHPEARVTGDLPELKAFMLYPYVMSKINDLTRDSVISKDDLSFRVDVPDGTYRVTLMIGDMSQAIGSMDVSMNGEKVADHVSAWGIGTRGAGNHRRILMEPYGGWTYVRHTVQAKAGAIRISLEKNQSFYDRELAGQQAHEAAWDKNYKAHYQRIGLSGPPYYFIGWLFAHHSIMAIEVVPDRLPPVVGKNDKLELRAPIASPALKQAIGAFNERRFAAALAAVEKIKEPEARVAKAIVELWLSGRLEVEPEKKLVPRALATLQQYVKAHPEENGVAEIALDAEHFNNGLQLHLTRGEVNKNHFLENDKAVDWWWMINEGTPLYYKAQLYMGRALHMLVPYFPTRGTEKEIFTKLEKKFPTNRHVKYHLHYTWDQYGDGKHPEDWRMTDYTAKVKDSPAWVKALYPSFANTIDLSEWWYTYRMEKHGTIGGGWGDDVEIIGLFAYTGFASRDVSKMLMPGTRTFMEGLWNMSEIDPELGYCFPLTDAEHAAEWTGNTLGMAVQIDYGNPQWIERSMKTAKLMRDYWTDFDNNGRRHFRSNYFAAAQIGSGDQMNDSFINYRAIRPAQTVLWYNRNPTIAALYLELADSWLAAAMSTERGKPRGVIPTEIAFPQGTLGGQNSPTWYTASHAEGTGNEDWNDGQGYKDYVQELFLIAYEQTGDRKYLEPLRLEYELASKYGKATGSGQSARLQEAPEPGIPGETKKALPNPGSEKWVGENLKKVGVWLLAKGRLEGKAEPLRADLTKEEIIKKASNTSRELKERWPLITTEAGPTDRVGFNGCVNPFLIYTGGRIGGPLLEAAVTYGNTTREFAAAVLATGPKGFRLIYHSLASDTREIEIYPWHLEAGARYEVRYGPDADENEKMDSTEKRPFEFPQLGTPFKVRMKPRTTYIVEVEQIEARKDALKLAPDPGLSPDDIKFDQSYGMVTGRIHNVGSVAIRGVEVAAYDGDPTAGGKLIGTQRIPNLEAPVDLEPKTVTVGFFWKPTKTSHTIHFVVDPNHKLTGEITTLNNRAAKTFQTDPNKLIFEFRGGT